MSLSSLIERTSFKQVFWAALLVGVVLTLPVTVALIQQETKLFSKADFRPPEAPRLKHGQAPTQPTEINSIEPFLGKEGDVVLVNGKNLGFYPEGSYISIGDTTVPEDHLVSWEDTQIVFYLPTIAKSGKVHLKSGPYYVTWPQILTVYNTNTKAKVSKKANSLLISNASNIKRVVYYHNEERYEKILARPVNAGEQPEVLIEKPETSHITWLTLFNPQDIVISFYVNPADFGF